MPVTGALRIAFVALLVLLIAGLVLHHRYRPRPSAVLRGYAAVSTLIALTIIMLAMDAGATDHELWSGVVAPIALTVFAQYAELWRREPPPAPVIRALRCRTAVKARAVDPSRRTTSS